MERLTDLYAQCIAVAVANGTRKAFMSALTSCYMREGGDMGSAAQEASARTLLLGSMGNRGDAGQHQHRLRPAST